MQTYFSVSSGRPRAAVATSFPQRRPFFIIFLRFASGFFFTKMSSTPRLKPRICKKAVNTRANADSSKLETTPPYSYKIIRIWQAITVKTRIYKNLIFGLNMQVNIYWANFTMLIVSDKQSMFQVM